MSGKTFSDEMTGIFGKNDYKQKDTHPDSRGRCKIKGVWYWISGWTRQAGSGNKFSSLAFTEMTMEEANKQEERSRARQAPQQPQQQQPQQQYQPEPPQDFDDDIPF